MSTNVALEIIAKNPTTALVGGGIILLILSPGFSTFGSWGWALIILGVLLQAAWIFGKGER
jgi:hypothetical protein